MRSSTDWRGQAGAYLRRHTRAMWDSIERFVELFWDQNISDEENLLAFQNYEAELQDAYSF